MSQGIDQSLIEAGNARVLLALQSDYDHLGEVLARSGADIEVITEKVAHFGVALPSWGVGTGGARFARFPGPGEPRNLFNKIADCRVIQQLTRATPRVSLHIPWDKVSDPSELRDKAAAQGLGFDAMNSNSFQDSPGQALSYKYGSLTHTDPAVRAQAVAHYINCIRFGQTVGSKALTVWIGDGSNFPGQSHLGRAFDRYLEAMRAIYAELADLQRAQNIRARFLFDRHPGLGVKLPGRNGARVQGEVPCGPRPPRAHDEHRDDRRATDPRGQARRLPLQRQQVW